MGGYRDEIGLLELFISHLKEYRSYKLPIVADAAAQSKQTISSADIIDADISNLFTTLPIIVPNPALALWLRDKITLACGIAANLKFTSLIGPIFEEIYRNNNPASQIFDFSYAKYIIYDYLCSHKLDIPDNHELHQYLYPQHKLDKLRSFQLASELAQIFEEYLYLRTDDLLQPKQAKIPDWQKQILNALLAHIKQLGEVTFLDIYTYFSQYELLKIARLPKQLFIFAINHIYPSQLQIIKHLAKWIKINWYYCTPSYEYYGDLLSEYAKSKLAARITHAPELSLDDLYLTDGNPLLANLAGQSREFIELLQSNDIAVYDFQDNHYPVSKCDSMLKIIQEDIRQINYRILPEYRLNINNSCYHDPINLAKIDTDHSIRINSCHNRMREVQVMFNEIISFLDSHPQVPLTEILVCAPNIDDYAPYIDAVFANEVVQSHSALADDHANSHKLLYNIIGNSQRPDSHVLEAIKLILNAPYQFPVSYLMQILAQTTVQQNLHINSDDIELVQVWLSENKVHFGYTESDYAIYGYENYGVHSFEHFLTNLVLGATVSNAGLIAQNTVPIFKHVDGTAFCPYNNIDSSQLILCNTLLQLLKQLKLLRQAFYLDMHTYKELTISELRVLLGTLFSWLITDPRDTISCNLFLGCLDSYAATTAPINLAILNLIVTEYTSQSNSSVTLTSGITCGSMRYLRGMPASYIYILGLNYDEFPVSYMPKRLSILADAWHLADRNYTIEDKQTFLDIILASKQQLGLSYIGRKETDNSVIKPSGVVTLVVNTVQQSFVNAGDVIIQQALHPFYNNVQPNYSLLWQQLASRCNEIGISENDASNQIMRWDFTQLSPFKLSQKQQEIYYKPTIKNLVDTFLYSNINLFRVLGVNTYIHEVEFADTEELRLHNRQLAKHMYSCFNDYSAVMLDSSYDIFQEYLKAQGILAYGHMGKSQFEYYSKLYRLYCSTQGDTEAVLKLTYNITGKDESIKLDISDKVRITDDAIIINENFANITSGNLAKTVAELPYELQIRALVICLLINNGAIIECADGSILRQINRVIIRQLNSACEVASLSMQVSDKQLINTILSYYVRSLTNPVLIHKAAIQKYASTSLMLDKHGMAKFSKEQCIHEAKQCYLATYNNYELERLKNDIIFATTTHEYFTLMQRSGSINDIVAIGNILANLHLRELS